MTLVTGPKTPVTTWSDAKPASLLNAGQGLHLDPLDVLHLQVIAEATDQLLLLLGQIAIQSAGGATAIFDSPAERQPQS